MEPSKGVVLSELIKPARIKLSLTGGHRDAVLEELVDLIPEAQEEPAARERLLKALREREQLHSTGIGDGVALPHARNALVGLVDQPVIVFGRHAVGIPYGAIDNKPAQLFFLLVAPSVTQHLAVLARISRVLHDPRLRQNLLTAGTVDQVRKVVGDAEAKMYGS
jgi:mannitol/fructose-specific phosphotransferase system IIA component (Ntr-type)